MDKCKTCYYYLKEILDVKTNTLMQIPRIPIAGFCKKAVRRVKDNVLLIIHEIFGRYYAVTFDDFSCEHWKKNELD